MEDVAPKVHGPWTAGTALPNRYPGTLPFADTDLDRIRFRGREEEVRVLFHQLLGAGLLVFFAKPGLGKTSLLNARLFHLLRQHDFLPLPVRFNQSNLTPPVTPIFLAAFNQPCSLEGIDYTAGVDHSLWEFFKTAVFWRGDRLQTPVLVLDQFEEIFELIPQFRRALAAELGQLTSGRLPDHLRQQAQAEEVLPFTESPPQVKILISLREDELGLLEELTSEIPGILRNRFRLTGLSNEDARRAIVEPANIEPEDIQFATPPFAYQEEVVEQIIVAATTFEGTIDPFFLQLLCTNVEKQVRESQRANGAAIEVDTGYLGGEKGVKALTAEFYHDAIRALPDSASQKRARRMCEEELVTLDGRRRSVPLDDLSRNFKVDAQALELLENARLLRSEPKLGTSYYEVSHDRLAEAIRDARSWRMPLRAWIALGILGTILLMLGVFWYREYTLRSKAVEAHAQAVKALDQAATARDQAAKARDQAAKALDQAQKLVEFLISNLGDKLTSIGRSDLLEEIRQRVEGYYEQMGTEGMSDDILSRISISYDSIGDVQRAQGYRKAALESYRKALDIRTKLADGDPFNTDWQRDLATSYINIGDVQSDQGDRTAAPESYRKALDIITKLAGSDPSNTGWQDNLSVSYDAIGNVQRAQGDLKTALESYHKALDIRTKLADGDPFNTDWQRDLATSYDNIGDAQRAQGDLRTALESYYKALDIRTKLTGSDRSNTSWQRDLSESYDRIGDAQHAQGDLKTALESYHKALDIRTKLTGTDRSNTGWQRDLSKSYNKIGDVQSARGDLKTALESYHKALDISAKLAALDGKNAEWEADLAYSHWEMAYLLGTLPNTDTRQSASECNLALEILRPLAEENRLTADQADWVPEIQTLLLSLTAPQKVPNKPPKRNP